MTEKILNTRIINKHETEENWLKSSFIPKQGEIIVYDVDNVYSYERMKIGDGVQNVNQLPFVDDAVRNLIGDTSIEDQISAAIMNSQADFSVMDETNPAFIKNKPTEEDAIALLMSTGFLIPVVNNNGDILTDSQENILFI